MENKIILIYTVFLLTLIQANSARAADLCETYVEYCPGYIRSVVAGGSYPSFSDTFNVNPASIPTTETPLGVEAITTTGSDRSTAVSNFSLIKGFNSAGIGISNNSDKSFYSYNLRQALQGTAFVNSFNGIVAKDSVMSSINLGAALSPIPKKLLSFITPPNIGLNLRYNELTQKWDLQYGVSLNSKYFTFGASYRKSQGTTAAIMSSNTQITVPTISTTAVTAGSRIGVLAAEYTLLFLKTPDPSLQTLPFFSKPVRIITTLLDIGRLHISFAHRTAYNVLNETQSTTLYAAQYEILKKLSLAFQHNYIPGSNSLSAQLLF